MENQNKIKKIMNKKIIIAILSMALISSPIYCFREETIMEKIVKAAVWERTWENSAEIISGIALGVAIGAAIVGYIYFFKVYGYSEILLNYRKGAVKTLEANLINNVKLPAEPTINEIDRLNDSEKLEQALKDVLIEPYIVEYLKKMIKYSESKYIYSKALIAHKEYLRSQLYEYQGTEHQWKIEYVIDIINQIMK